MSKEAAAAAEEERNEDDDKKLPAVEAFTDAVYLLVADFFFQKIETLAAATAASIFAAASLPAPAFETEKKTYATINRKADEGGNEEEAFKRFKGKASTTTDRTVPVPSGRKHEDHQNGGPTTELPSDCAGMLRVVPALTHVHTHAHTNGAYNEPFYFPNLKQHERNLTNAPAPLHTTGFALKLLKEKDAEILILKEPEDDTLDVDEAMAILPKKDADRKNQCRESKFKKQKPASTVCNAWADWPTDAHVNLLQTKPILERSWEDVHDELTWACFLAEGGAKKVYKVYNSVAKQEEAVSVM